MMPTRGTMKRIPTSKKQAMGRLPLTNVLRHRAAFTLAEVMMAVMVAGIFTAGVLSSIMVNQVVTRKAKEEALMANFLVKYLEHIKALPFDSVLAGQPINSLYNGVSGAPNILIPASTNWVSINTTDYQVFFPDLLWLTNRNPQLKVILTTRSVSGLVHDKEINAHVAWDAPTQKGARTDLQMDLLRTANVPTL